MFFLREKIIFNGKKNEMDQRIPSMLFNSHSQRIQVGHFDDTILRLPLKVGEDTKNVES